MQQFGVQVLETLIGVLVGAFTAFRLEAHTHRLREKRHRAGQLRRGILTLAAQWNYLFQVKAEMLDPVRENENRGISMPAVVLQSTSAASDFNELAFVLGDRDGQLLLELDVIERRFRQIVRMVEMRTDMHRRFQEQVESFPGEDSLAQRRSFDREELHAHLGHSLFWGLTSLTEGLYELVDCALEAHQRVAGQLKGVGRRLFPGEPFPSIDASPASAERSTSDAAETSSESP